MEIAKSIEDVFESGDVNTHDAYVKKISTELSSGALKLLDVIETLGPKLTSSNVQDREMGMGFLALVLSNLNSDFLSQNELSFVVDFLHDRLKDQHLVIPKVILAILPVIKSKNLPPGSSSKILQQLFQEANIQSQTHKYRRVFFEIIQHLLLNNLNELKELGSDFVMGFLQAMDGEKDPRNLLLLFNFIPTILSNISIGPFSEDFFEILTMYFPIDFNPSSGGPEDQLITREDLANSLHLCLSQTNQFSEQLIPLALEKLESSVLDAKLDSLKLLTMCCERSYTPEDLRPHLPAIWHAMRREIFMGGNEEVEKAANILIKSAFKILSINKEILDYSLQLVFSECKHHLSEPELRLSLPASRILCSIASGSEITCSSVMLLTLPLLYEQFMIKTSNPERRGILGIMISVVSVIREFPLLSLSKLLEKWDDIIWMCFSLLTHSHHEFVVLSLRFFHTLLGNMREINKILKDGPQDINEKNRDLLQAHLLSILEKRDVNPDILSLVVNVLEELTNIFPEECIKISLPKLLNLSKLTIVSGSDEDDDDIIENSLTALEAISSSFDVSKVVIPNLVKGIVDSTEHRDILVGCLLRILEKNCVKDQAKDFVVLLSSFLSDLIKVVIEVRSVGNTELYAQLVGIIRVVIMTAEFTKQQELIDTFWNERVMNINLQDLGQINVIPGLLGEGILGSVRPSIRIAKKSELMKLILEKVSSKSEQKNTDLYKETNQTPNDLDLLANIRLYSTFLNKARDDEFLDILKEIEEFLENVNIFSFPAEDKNDVDDNKISPAEEALYSNMELDENKHDYDKMSNVITLFIWTVKSLAMRGFPDLDLWMQKKVIPLLRHPVYGNLVAEGFSVLMADCAESLNVKSYCNYRILYKQRIFQLSLPLLVSGYKEASNEVKSNYIRALTGQLRDVPQVVLQMELSNVVPLLVGSLEYDLPGEDEKEAEIISRNTPNAPLLLSSLTALMELLSLTSEQNSETEILSPLLEYFMDFTPRLLRLAQYKGFMEIRILALQCLQRCAKFPLHLILPIKEQVVSGLRMCLDDPKRLVRREAVRCKLIWTLIGAPGGI